MSSKTSIAQQPGAQREDAAEELFAILRALLPAEAGPYPLHEPEFDTTDHEQVDEALTEGFVSYAGRHVGLFEEALAAQCGTQRAVAMVSGTAAIQMMLIAAGVGPGDEVLCPSLTFAGSAAAIVHAGALPHFVDCAPDSLGIDADRLDARLAAIATQQAGRLVNRETGNRIAAIMPMHTFGHVGDLPGLRTVAERWGLMLFEDAAQALGSRDAHGLVFRGGHASAVSFNGNKIATTGGGGAVLTNDDIYADRLKHLTTTAKIPHRWRFDHDAIGYNARMPNLNAALGLAQLARLDSAVARKRALAQRYAAAFAGARYWRSLSEPAGAASNYWLNVVLLPEARPDILESALDSLCDAGLYCRPCWTPLHQLPVYSHAPRDALPVTDDMAARIICLPSSPKLADVITG